MWEYCVDGGEKKATRELRPDEEWLLATNKPPSPTHAFPEQREAGAKRHSVWGIANTHARVPTSRGPTAPVCPRELHPLRLGSRTPAGAGEASATVPLWLRQNGDEVDSSTPPDLLFPESV